jgi:hypothetical protein
MLKSLQSRFYLCPDDPGFSFGTWEIYIVTQDPIDVIVETATTVVSMTDLYQ